MRAIDYVLIALIALWFIGSIAYIIYSKKKGKSCCHCSSPCQKACKDCDRCHEENA